MAKARTQKQEPDFRPHLELAPAQVDNPMWSRAHDGDKTNPRKISAVINIRESPAAYLFARGSIDEAQLKAADQFRRLFEAMGGSGARAIDWRKEAVDGGKFPDPIGTHAIDAGKKLAKAYEAVTHVHGIFAWSLLGRVCGEGVHITGTRREVATGIDNLKAYLDVLTEHWQMASPSKRD